MNTLSKWIIGGISVALALVLVFFLFQSKDTAFGLADSSFVKYGGDVVGSKTGTSTIGVAFSVTPTGGQSATSSYISRIGGNKDLAIYQFTAVKVSSTANLVAEVLGSNDDFCWTTNTSAAVDEPLMSNITWVSAGDHFKGIAQSASSIGNSSSTRAFSWLNPVVQNGAEVILTDLTFECLKLNVSGSSTEAYVSVRTK